MSTLDPIGDAVRAVERRLVKAVAALRSSAISYALTDDNAVAVHVSQVDTSAVRNTPDVSILIQREDFEAVKNVMIAEGLTHHSHLGTELFTDTPQARRGVQFFFACEPVAPGSFTRHPDLRASQTVGGMCVLSVLALARTKLATFRDRDRLNLRDLIDVGLIDQTWPARFPAELAARLQLLLDTPGG